MFIEVPKISISSFSWFLDLPKTTSTVLYEDVVVNLKLIIYFQRQDDYEYDESADYGEQDETEAALGLPADSSSIRENIVDEFTCDARPYGYYADVANECQIFHICYPVTYADGEEEMFKWSFICPNGTIFDQVCA